VDLFPVPPQPHVGGVVAPAGGRAGVRAAPGSWFRACSDLSVDRFTLPAMKDEVATAGVVEAIARASLEGAEELLRTGGWCLPPSCRGT
jgi:hypothetical protein